MTYNEFYRHICELPTRFENRDLETYLSALYTLVDENQNVTPNAEMLLNLVQTAFTSVPTQFNSDWLRIEQPPGNNSQEIFGIEFTLEVIKFQISELHKMRGKQLNSETKYFGIDSETENRWYNFDPFTILECGTAGLMENFEADDREIEGNWQFLGNLLEIGRVYE